MFNCFQAVAFYTLLPFAIQYLFSNGQNSWGYIASAALAIGYVMLSIVVSGKW